MKNKKTPYENFSTTINTFRKKKKPIEKKPEDIENKLGFEKCLEYVVVFMFCSLLGACPVAFIHAVHHDDKIKEFDKIFRNGENNCNAKLGKVYSSKDVSVTNARIHDAIACYESNRDLCLEKSLESESPESFDEKISVLKALEKESNSLQEKDLENFMSKFARISTSSICWVRAQ